MSDATTATNGFAGRARASNVRTMSQTPGPATTAAPQRKVKRTNGASDDADVTVNSKHASCAIMVDRLLSRYLDARLSLKRGDPLAFEVLAQPERSLIEVVADRYAQ
eukprot:6712542-Prymnesium_polylepis.1